MPRIAPPEMLPPVQLEVHVKVYALRNGGCSMTFSAPDGSRLVKEFGSGGRALAACRDTIVQDLDNLIAEFKDEDD